MVYISTDYSAENIKKYMLNQSDYFSAVTLNTPLDDIDKQIILDIDKAYVLDNYRIDGIYGETNIRDISNGSKTVLNLRNMLKREDACYIDITSCGDNAIETLIKVLNNIENLEHKDVYLLTCLKNYISTTPIKMILNEKVEINSFFEVAQCIE